MTLENEAMVAEDNNPVVTPAKEAVWVQYIRMGRRLELAGAVGIAELFYKRGEELAYKAIDPKVD